MTDDDSLPFLQLTPDMYFFYFPQTLLILFLRHISLADDYLYQSQIKIQQRS